MYDKLQHRRSHLCAISVTVVLCAALVVIATRGGTKAAISFVNMPFKKVGALRPSYEDYFKSALHCNFTDWTAEQEARCQADVINYGFPPRICVDLRLAAQELWRVRLQIPYQFCWKKSDARRKSNQPAGVATQINMFVADYHTGLVRDFKHFFAIWVAPRLGNVKFNIVDQSLSAYCLLEAPPTCIRPDQIGFLRRDNAWNECPTQEEFQMGFWESLKHDKVIAETDVFLCTLPIHGCMRYVPFNRPFILIEAVDGVNYPAQTTETLLAYQRLQPHKVTLGHNYARSKVKPWRPLYTPSYCGGAGTMQPQIIKSLTHYVYVHIKGGSRQHFVNVPISIAQLETEINQAESTRGCPHQETACLRRRFVVQNLMVATSNFNLSRLTNPNDLAASIIVSTCFQTSFMSSFEMYRTNIPMFFPKKQAEMQGDVSFYPGVQYFDTVSDLAQKIVATDLTYHNMVQEVFGTTLGEVLAELWAWRFREMMPGIHNGLYQRPGHNTSLNISTAWEHASGIEWKPSRNKVVCTPPDALFKVSPHTP